MKKLILFCLVFLCLQPVFGEKPKVAVMLEDRTGKLLKNSDMLLEMENMFAKRVQGKFTTISLDKKQKELIIKLQKETQSMEKNKNYWIDFGNQTSAQHLFYAVITSFGKDSYSVLARLINLKNGEYLASDPVDFKGGAKVRESFRDAFIKVVEDLVSETYKWSSLSALTMDWDTAKRYCSSLTEGGYYDWRLPTISELRTIIITTTKYFDYETQEYQERYFSTATGGECRVADSCLSAKECWTESECWPSRHYERRRGSFSKLEEDDEFSSLWSSSILSEDTKAVWCVKMGDGRVTFNFKSDDLNVRCVRGKI